MRKTIEPIVTKFGTRDDFQTRRSYNCFCSIRSHG